MNAHGQTPTVTLSVKDFQSLISGVKRVVSAASSETGATIEAQLRGALGVGPDSGIDETRPWEVAIWVESLERTPAVSVRVPVANRETFGDAFASKKTLGVVSMANSEASMEYSGDYANIWLEGGETSDGVVEAHESWSADDLNNIDGLIDLNVELSEALRGAFKQSIGMGRTMFNGAISQAPEDELSGVQPASIMKMMGLYFDFAEMVIDGAEGFNASMNVDEAGIRLREGVRVVAESEFAQFARKPAHSIQKMVSLIDPAASAGIAIQIEENSGMKSFMEEYLGIAFSMFGEGEETSEFYTEMMSMMEKALPTVLNASYYFEDGLAFNGAYEFPEGDTDEFLESYYEFAKSAAEFEIGGTPIYESTSVEKHEFPGLGLDGQRIQMAMNLDSPVFAASGDEGRAMIEAMWGGSEITIDIAEKDDVVYFGGNGGSERLRMDRGDAVIQPKVAIDDRSIAYVRFDLVRLLPMFVGTNPAIPDEAKEFFEKMRELNADPVEFVVRADGASIVSETFAPLSLIEAIGELAE